MAQRPRRTVNLGNNFFQEVCTAYDLDYDLLLDEYRDLRKRVVGPHAILCSAQMFLQFEDCAHQAQAELLAIIKEHIKICEQEAEMTTAQRLSTLPEPPRPASHEASTQVSSTTGLLCSSSAPGRVVRMSTVVRSAIANLRVVWSQQLAPVLRTTVLGGQIVKATTNVIAGQDKQPKKYRYTYAMKLYVQSSKEAETVAQLNLSSVNQWAQQSELKEFKKEQHALVLPKASCREGDEGSGATNEDDDERRKLKLLKRRMLS
eukprot:TRINITY_DN2703_c0_g1_i1.p1 TRINITY_DN2703_c0_g1~~TRINITY_DN2703_c0_g1_i1.p1  ORF type:complete len:276 (-),score=39.02 TRINITY_DN2703_c0_g1_i1:741-1523(-)